ncbi:MAG: glutamyl-tRNA synthetase [Phycisphaerales bacterium]|jgi:glutamyl-tRNA synthetase|nr:glutamyl-tRNA synthetase [Phycisphaerales bacterium]
MATVVSRFAPSPTGYLHVGGARTALFAWLLARHAGADGKFLLRIEDTDAARSTEQATTQLLEDLRWLGLHWDNAELVHQSKRKDVYNAIIDSLIAQNLAYKAYDTREELDALRKIAEKEKRQFIYRRREISGDERQKFEAEGRPAVVRFAMPVKEYRFHDAVLGEIVLPADEVQDFVIRKEDGMPTYHFAVVVDDAEMGVTHILRGQEHTKNTFLHIALQDALGYARPVYGHLSTILNLDGSKMGKRDRDKKIRQAAQLWLKNPPHSLDALASACGFAPPRLEQWLKDSKQQLDLPEQSAVMHAIGLAESDLPEILVHDFRKKGYIPEALLNFLALLGWNPGGDKELMSMDEMQKLFSIEGIGKSNAKFDRSKLLAFNTQHGERTPAKELVPAFRAYLEVNPDSPLNQATDEQLATLLEMKKGFRLLREVDEASRFLFIPDDAILYDPAAVEKVLKKDSAQGLSVLRDLHTLLVAQTDFSHTALEQTIQTYGEQKQLGLGKIAQPLRVAVTGNTISPPIFQSLEMLGKDRTLARIERCLRTAV